VSSELNRALKIRAEQAGLTVPEYLLRDTERSEDAPTMAELTERIRNRKPVDLDTPTADLIREERESR
jgi:hypothetical protein